MKHQEIPGRKLKRFSLHAAAVSCYVAWELFSQLARSGDYSHLEIYAVFYLFDISYFYFSAFKFLPVIYARYTGWAKKLAAILLLVVSNAFLLTLVNTLLLSYLLHKLVFQIRDADFLLATIRSAFIMVISFSLWLNRYRIEKERELHYQKSQKILAENRTLKLENNLLRANVNPHLFNNTLSSVYARLSSDPSEAIEIIELLVDINNYSFVSNDEEGKVRLADDLDNLQKFITLQRKLGKDKLNIYVLIEVDEGSIRIPPLLFIDLIENMVKYGDLTRKTNPGVVKISLQEHVLVCHVSNLKATHSHNIGHGSGLVTIEQRLRRHYPGAYAFYFGGNGDWFEVNLKIYL